MPVPDHWLVTGLSQRLTLIDRAPVPREITRVEKPRTTAENANAIRATASRDYDGRVTCLPEASTTIGLPGTASAPDAVAVPIEEPLSRSEEADRCLSRALPVARYGDVARLTGYESAVAAIIRAVVEGAIAIKIQNESVCAGSIDPD
jgi:hypothetical protein